MCGTTSQKISKDIQDLKNTIKQINLPCIRTVCPTMGEESACNVGDLGSIPGLGRSSGEGNGYPLQYSGLESSMHCIVHRVTKSQTWLSGLHFDTFTQQQQDYTLFSSAQRIFTKIDNMLGCKTSLNKLKRIKITQNMFSNQIELNEKSATGENLGNPQLFDMKQHISKQLTG